MIIQVGGSISFAPESDGQAAKWLSDDTRHMLAELDPKPDQVTVTVNTTQMNVTEHAGLDDFNGVSRGFPHLHATYKDMIVPANPSWVEEHIRRLTAAGIQSEFQCYNINSFETIERMIRRGVYKGPLVMNWVAISGGMDQANIYNLANFLRAAPDGAKVGLNRSSPAPNAVGRANRCDSSTAAAQIAYCKPDSCAACEGLKSNLSA